EPATAAPAAGGVCVVVGGQCGVGLGDERSQVGGHTVGCGGGVGIAVGGLAGGAVVGEIGVVVGRVADDLDFAGGVVGVVAPDGDDVELLRRVGWVVALEHVDDDDGDVVAAASLVGGVDQGLGGGGGIV